MFTIKNKFRNHQEVLEVILHQGKSIIHGEKWPSKMGYTTSLLNLAKLDKIVDTSYIIEREIEK